MGPENNAHKLPCIPPIFFLRFQLVEQRQVFEMHMEEKRWNGGALGERFGLSAKHFGIGSEFNFCGRTPLLYMICNLIPSVFSVSRTVNHFF